jgi:hypothetical protein
MRASAWLPPVLTILFSKADGLAPPTVPWLACASAVEVNRAVEQHVRPGDCVVEMGSQLKETSRLICDAVGATGTALLCDVARKSPRVSTSRNANFRRGDDLQSVPPQATWIELESFDGWRCAPALDASFKGASAPCDVLVCDLGGMTGNDLILTTVSFCREFLSRMKGGGGGHQPRAVIVKSTALCGLAWRLIHAQRLFAGSASLPLPGDGDSGGGGSGDDGCTGEKREEGGQFRAPRGTAGEPFIVATVGVEEYRRTIPSAVRLGDGVLEVGCHLGVTTALLHEAAGGSDGGGGGGGGGGCIGVDIGARIINGARERFPHVSFSVGDAWRIASLHRLRKELLPSRRTLSPLPEAGTGTAADTEGGDGNAYDVVYVDVGGLSGSDGLLEALSLLGSIGHGLEPRVIVIKSLCMRRLASSLRPFSDVWNKERKRSLLLAAEQQSEAEDDVADAGQIPAAAGG